MLGTGRLGRGKRFGRREIRFMVNGGFEECLGCL